jgi:hypothetical protein
MMRVRARKKKKKKRKKRKKSVDAIEQKSSQSEPSSTTTALLDCGAVGACLPNETAAEIDYYEMQRKEQLSRSPNLNPLANSFYPDHWPKVVQEPRCQGDHRSQ